MAAPSGQTGILLVAVILLLLAIPQRDRAALRRNWVCSSNAKVFVAVHAGMLHS